MSYTLIVYSDLYRRRFKRNIFKYKIYKHGIGHLPETIMITNSYEKIKIFADLNVLSYKFRRFGRNCDRRIIYSIIDLV